MSALQKAPQLGETTAPSPAPAPAGAHRPVLQLDPVTRTVQRGDERLVLGSRAYDLLSALASQPGRVHSTSALLQAAWPGRAVEAQNLRVQILQLRRQLGADIVINVPGRGYTLGLPVRQPDGHGRNHAAAHPETALVGREADLQRVDSQLQPQRPVCLLGPAGVGKTRLAAEIARRRLTRHADGTWMVDLVRVQSAAAVPAAIAHTLVLQVGDLLGPQAARRVGLALAGRDLLLVLDNAEHLGAALGPVVHQLLAAAPTVCLLATSRGRLACPLEHVVALGPLAVPPPQARADECRDSPALQVLQQSARRVDPSFALQDHELADAVQLCQRLDGLPLALELAGAALPKGGLAEALRGQAEHPGKAARAEHRQASLRSALAWSYRLLDSVERVCLRRLCLFSGSFRLDEAWQVAAFGGVTPEQAMRGVLTLGQHSLLQPQPGLGSRYRLLETTRAFAHAQLVDAGEEAATRRSHVQALARLAARAAQAFWLLPDDGWLAQWNADGPNWLQACDWACQMHDAPAAAALSDALACQAAITGHYAALRQRQPQLLALAEGASGRTRALLLDRLDVAPVQGIDRLAGARERVAAWRAVGTDKPALCRALADLAHACELAGERDACDAALLEAQALEEPGWTARERAYGSIRVLPSLAACRQQLTLLKESSQTLQASCAACGSPRLTALARCDMGMHAQFAGQPLEASMHMEEAASALRRAGFDVDAGVALGMLAGAWLDAGDRVQAGLALRQAVALLQADPDALRFLLEVMALAAAYDGRHAQASQLLGASLALRERTALARNPLNSRMAQAAEDLAVAAQGPRSHGECMARGQLLSADEALGLAQRLWPSGPCAER